MGISLGDAILSFAGGAAEEYNKQEEERRQSEARINERIQSLAIDSEYNRKNTLINNRIKENQQNRELINSINAVGGVDSPVGQARLAVAQGVAKDMKSAAKLVTGGNWTNLTLPQIKELKADLGNLDVLPERAAKTMKKHFDSFFKGYDQDTQLNEVAQVSPEAQQAMLAEMAKPGVREIKTLPDGRFLNIDEDGNPMGRPYGMRKPRPAPTLKTIQFGGQDLLVRGGQIVAQADRPGDVKVESTYDEKTGELNYFNKVTGQPLYSKNISPKVDESPLEKDINASMRAQMAVKNAEQRGEDASVIAKLRENAILLNRKAFDTIASTGVGKSQQDQGALNDLLNLELSQPSPDESKVAILKTRILEQQQKIERDIQAKTETQAEEDIAKSQRAPINETFNRLERQENALVALDRIKSRVASTDRTLASGVAAVGGYIKNEMKGVAILLGAEPETLKDAETGFSELLGIPRDQVYSELGIESRRHQSAASQLELAYLMTLAVKQSGMRVTVDMVRDMKTISDLSGSTESILAGLNVAENLVAGGRDQDIVTVLTNPALPDDQYRVKGLKLINDLAANSPQLDADSVQWSPELNDYIIKPDPNHPLAGKIQQITAKELMTRMAAARGRKIGQIRK